MPDVDHPGDVRGVVARRAATGALLLPARYIAWPFLIWVYLWDNARTRSVLLDAPLTTIVPFPTSLRALEVGIVLLLFAATILQARHWRRSQRVGVVALLCFLALSAVSGAVSVASQLTRVGPAAQMVYSFVAPLLIAVIIGLRPARPGDAPATVKWLTIAVGISAFVAWWQIVHLHAFADDVHGLMRDAHHFASAVWIVAFWWIARLSAGVGSKRTNVVGLLFFVPTALLASNEKSNVAFGLVLFAAAAIALWQRNWLYRVAIAGSIIAGFGVLELVAKGEIELPRATGHLQLVLENLSNIGFFKGYAKVLTVTEEYPRILAIGAGPASYGSFKAVDPVVTDGKGEPPPLAREYTAESYRLIHVVGGVVGSYLEESTDLSAFFVELGPVAMLLFGVAVWALVINPARRAARAQSAVQVAMGRWTILSTAFALLMSAFSAFYGWAAIQATVWPIMLVAGLLDDRALHDTDGHDDEAKLP